MANTNKKAVTKSGPSKTSATWPSMYEEFDRLIHSYFNRNWPRLFWPENNRSNDLSGTFEMHSPSMDIIDRDNEVVVKVELPGVEKKDLDVSISNDTLTIKGTSGKEHTEEKGDYYRSEIRKGTIARAVSLPQGVDSSKADAKFKDGILELTLPKMTSSTRKTVKIT